MKKGACIALIGLLLVIAMAIPASASDYVEVGGYFEWSSPKNDEVLCGEAGEATTTWDVPLLAQTPVLDGIIMPGEYARFENFEDYMSFAATTNVGQPTFEKLCEIARGGIFDAYWGWDGQYMYLAFAVDCIDGYYCSPSQDVMLFAYNCLQVGMAPVDAQGKAENYLEMGFGYDNKADRDITFTWCGNYYSAEEDFAGYYDEGTQRVTYELRIDLQQALSRESYPEAGDQINFAFLLEISGDNDPNKNVMLMFCHGIGGQYSMKRNEYFARITLSDQVFGEVETTDPESEFETEPETEPETTRAETEPEVTIPEETIPEAVDTTEWYTEVEPFYTVESVEVVPLPDVDIPEELPSPDVGEMFGSGGMLQKLLEYVDLSGCTSVTFAGLVPLMLVLGVLFIKKKGE